MKLVKEIKVDNFRDGIRKLNELAAKFNLSKNPYNSYLYKNNHTKAEFNYGSNEILIFSNFELDLKEPVVISECRVLI